MVIGISIGPILYLAAKEYLYTALGSEENHVTEKAFLYLDKVETISGLVERVNDIHEDDYIRFCAAMLIGEKLKSESVEKKAAVLKELESAPKIGWPMWGFGTKYFAKMNHPLTPIELVQFFSTHSLNEENTSKE